MKQPKFLYVRLDNYSNNTTQVPVNIKRHKDGSITINKELLDVICKDYGVPIWVSKLLGGDKEYFSYDPFEGTIRKP